MILLKNINTGEVSSISDKEFRYPVLLDGNALIFMEFVKVR